MLNELLGKKLFEINGLEKGNDEAIFTFEDGTKYKMYHEQDCCESVYIEDVIGNVENLIGSPLVMAEDVTENGEDDFGTITWTFYKFATNKGYVTIRWCGSSNGFYSESVNFIQID